MGYLLGLWHARHHSLQPGQNVKEARRGLADGCVRCGAAAAQDPAHQRYSPPCTTAASWQPSMPDEAMGNESPCVSAPQQLPSSAEAGVVMRTGNAFPDDDFLAAQHLVCSDADEPVHNASISPARDPLTDAKASRADGTRQQHIDGHISAGNGKRRRTADLPSCENSTAPHCAGTSSLQCTGPRSSAHSDDRSEGSSCMPGSSRHSLAEAGRPPDSTVVQEYPDASSSHSFPHRAMASAASSGLACAPSRISQQSSDLSSKASLEPSCRVTMHPDPAAAKSSKSGASSAHASLPAAGDDRPPDDASNLPNSSDAGEAMEGRSSLSGMHLPHEQAAGDTATGASSSVACLHEAVVVAAGASSSAPIVMQRERPRGTGSVSTLVTHHGGHVSLRDAEAWDWMMWVLKDRIGVGLADC